MPSMLHHPTQMAPRRSVCSYPCPCGLLPPSDVTGSDTPPAMVAAVGYLTLLFDSFLISSCMLPHGKIPLSVTIYRRAAVMFESSRGNHNGSSELIFACFSMDPFL